jgi:hypothetical protein
VSFQRRRQEGSEGSVEGSEGSEAFGCGPRSGVKRRVRAERAFSDGAAGGSGTGVAGTVCVCVCVCASESERQTEREIEIDRERESVCVCVRERERERERERDPAFFAMLSLPQHTGRALPRVRAATAATLHLSVPRAAACSSQSDTDHSQAVQQRTDRLRQTAHIRMCVLNYCDMSQYPKIQHGQSDHPELSLSGPTHS